MHTVKVSLDRLQILNDRINLAIEALNELRCSVHGLERASGSTATLAADVARGVPAMSGLAHSSVVDPTIAATLYGQALVADRIRACNANAAYPFLGNVSPGI